MPSLPSRQTGHGDSQQLQAPRPAAWDLHFPGTDYVAEDRRAVLVRELEVRQCASYVRMHHGFAPLQNSALPSCSCKPDPRRSAHYLLRDSMSPPTSHVFSHLQRYFATDAGWDVLSALQLHGTRCSLQLDFARLVAENGGTDLSAAMQYQPVEALGCIAAAIFEVGF